MPKTLGLDLGIASIGWCLYESEAVKFDVDENGVASRIFYAPTHIIDLGSFVFNQIENEKGKTENVVRRGKRLMRRQRRRKAFKKKLIRKLFKDAFGVDFLDNVIAAKAVKENPFEIKKRGLSEKLTPNELMVALYHYVKWRGFKSNRKSIDGKGKGGDSDTKKMLKGISSLKEKLAEEAKKGNSPYVTPYLLSQSVKVPGRPDLNEHIHNREKEFSLTVDRETYQKEIEAFLDKQISFGVINEDFKKSYLSIWSYQRNFSDGPNRGPYVLDMDKIIGRCSFDDQPRAPKNSISARKFILASSLVNLRYKVEGDTAYRQLTPEQISSFLASDKIYSASIKYSTILSFLKIKDCVAIKSLDLSRRQYIDLLNKFKRDNGIDLSEQLDQSQEVEFKKLVKSKTFDKNIVPQSTFIAQAKMIGEDKRLTERESEFAKTDEFFDFLANVLLRKKDDEAIKKELAKTEGFGENLINAILDTDIDSKQVIDLSLDICRKLLPYLTRGMTYDKAMQEIGYKHAGEDDRAEIRGKIPPIDEALAEMGVVLTNPVVKHALANLRKILVAIVDVYGQIDDCVVELARELKKSFEERKTIRASQIDNQYQNNLLRNRMMEDFPDTFRSYSKISNTDLLRLKLYHEQRGISPYTNKPIPYREIFSNSYQVDHIMPFSKSFDDSFTNKVLVEAKANADKGDNLPRMFLENIKIFLANNKSISDKKRENLLRSEIPDDFIAKDLVDTGYLSKLARKFITFYMLPSGVSCRSTSGGVTSLMRKHWKLSGKTHTYYKLDSSNYVSFENNLYQVKFFEDFAFKSVSYEKESLIFTFSTKNNGFDEDNEIPFKKKSNKRQDGKEKELSAEDQALNNAIDYYLANEALFVGHFRNAYNLPFDKLQETVSGRRLLPNVDAGSINVSESEFFDHAMTLLNFVRIGIQKIIDKKNRDNHLHHALDAAVIGAVTPSVIYNISNANKEGFADRLVFPEPYGGFKEEVLARVYERDPEKLLNILNNLPQYRCRQLTKYDVHVLIPVRQPNHVNNGPLSKETIKGVRDVYNEETKVVERRLVKTISVEKIKMENVSDIVDAKRGNKEVASAISDWLRSHKKTKYPVLPKKGTFIKKVKIYEGVPEGAVPLSSNGDRYADNEDCIRVDVYKKAGSPKLFFVPVFLYQKFNQKRGVKNTFAIWSSQKDFSLVDEDSLNKHYVCVARLPRYSLIEVVCNNQKVICYSGGFSAGKLEVYSCLGDFVDIRNLLGSKQKDRQYMTCSTIASLKVRSISVLGKLS